MKSKTLVMCLVCVMAMPIFVRADDSPPADFKQLYEDQKKRNDELERRLRLLEEKDAADVYVKQESVPESTLSFIKQTEISGFVSASYFYNFNTPNSRENTGRGFDVKSAEFMINKAVLTLERPVEYNAFDWAAGYKVTTVFGQDASYMQPAGFDLGADGDLFEANLTVNAPLGNGLKVTLGICGTVIGYESTMTEQNFNWSGGYLWTLAEPFTHTGVMLKYMITPELESTIMINNGWDNVDDNNNALSYIGQLTWTPNDNNTVSLIGYGGPEQDDNSSNWRSGIEGWAEHRFTPQIKTAVQIDFGREAGADANGGTADWFGTGLWLIYEPAEKWTMALRGDYFNDNDGVRTSDAPANAPFAANTGQELYSLTYTLNFKPVPEVRIAPEIRWDRSSWNDAFDGHQDQVTIGFGAAYFY